MFASNFKSPRREFKMYFVAESMNTSLGLKLKASLYRVVHNQCDRPSDISIEVTASFVSVLLKLACCDSVIMQ